MGQFGRDRISTLATTQRWEALAMDVIVGGLPPGDIEGKNGKMTKKATKLRAMLIKVFKRMHAIQDKLAGMQIFLVIRVHNSYTPGQTEEVVGAYVAAGDAAEYVRKNKPDGNNPSLIIRSVQLK